jgi:hypothetical protein
MGFAGNDRIDVCDVRVYETKQIQAGLKKALAAMGIIVPPLTGILPWLMPLAANGIICIMLGAMTLDKRVYGKTKRSKA